MTQVQFLNEPNIAHTLGFDALYRHRCLKILVGYGMGPRALRILRMYWGRLTVVSKAGGYFSLPLQGLQQCKPRIPIYSMIFNVV